MRIDFCGFELKDLNDGFRNAVLRRWVIKFGMTWLYSGLDLGIVVSLNQQDRRINQYIAKQWTIMIPDRDAA